MRSLQITAADPKLTVLPLRLLDEEIGQKDQLVFRANSSSDDGGIEMVPGNFSPPVCPLI